VAAKVFERFYDSRISLTDCIIPLPKNTHILTLSHILHLTHTHRHTRTQTQTHTQPRAHTHSLGAALICGQAGHIPAVLFTVGLAGTLNTPLLKV